MANGGMHRSFGLGRCSYSNFDESPRALVEGTGTVALLSQFLKGLPHGVKRCGEGFDSLRHGRLFHLRLLSLCWSDFRSLTAMERLQHASGYRAIVHAP